MRLAIEVEADIDSEALFLDCGCTLFACTLEESEELLKKEDADEAMAG